MNKQVYTNIDETIYSKTLDNGLTVLLLPKRDMSKVYSLFTTDYGSIDQTFVPIDQQEEITVPAGIAHFLEHKLFEKEDRDVFADFGKQGASANAYTSFTKTAYLFSATNHIEKNVETLLDFVQDPYFSEQSVEKEKGIIAQEIKMYDDQPSWQAFMGTVKAMFYDHPVNQDIAGTVDSIMTITKEDLYTCYHTFYHPENMTLFIAGNFDEEAMLALIEENQAKKQFSKVDTIERFYPAEQKEVAMKEHRIHMPVSIPRCTIGIKELATTLDKDDFLKRDLMQNMLIDYYFSQSGPFYQELYEQGLIDDSFSVSTTLEKNFGYSLIGSNTERVDAFAAKVKQLLLSTNEATLTKETFATMKKKKIGELLQQMNSLEAIANQYTHYHMLGLDYFEFIPAIQALTVDEANDFLKQWIDEDRLAVCTISAT